MSAATDLTTDQVKERIYRNSISNYLFLVMRLGLGLVIFRMIYQHLPKEEFGFWALLWSVFGYGILLDFGFGFTAQKRVAELCVHRDWDTLSRCLSTILFTYVGVAALIFLLGIVGAPLIIKIMAVSPANERYFTQVLALFMIGTGFLFPLGIFPEILRGQQRITTVNYIQLAGYVASAILTIISLRQGWGLIWLVIITMGCSVLSEIACGFAAMTRMPHVRLSPKLFSRAMIRETTRFSVFAYVNTLTTVILTRTDQIIISVGIAVSAVAVYQVGAKVAELFSAFALQIADTLSPAAAHLHAKGDKSLIRSLLIKGTRFSILLATPLYLICAFFMTGLLRILTGENLAGSEAWWVGQALLLWYYIMIVTQSVTKRIFMMCGHERRLMWLGIGEAVMNLAVSILLVAIFRNVLVVAIGSLIATSFFGWFYLWPWAAKEAGIRKRDLAAEVLTPAWVACAPLIALIFIFRNVESLHVPQSFARLALEGSIAALVAGLGLWKLALNAEERARFTGFFNRIFGRRTVA